jgi:hypothetical protein
MRLDSFISEAVRSEAAPTEPDFEPAHYDRLLDEDSFMRSSRPTTHYLLVFSLVLSMCALCATNVALSAETKGYVVSWFHTATYVSPDNCPNGENPGTSEYREQNLIKLGYTKEQALAMVTSPKVADTQKIRALLVYRGIHNGKPANVYNFPTSVPDSHLNTVAGKYMYGFNLNGRVEPGSFEDPETHEKGVDNQLWKAVGCFKDYELSLPNRPFYEQAMWDAMIDTMPAWSMMVSGNDLSKDGPVTVTFDKTLKHLRRGATGSVMSDATFPIDPNPRSHHVFGGEIKNHVLTIQPGHLLLEGESPTFTEVNLTNTHLRLHLDENGDLEGYIGGYQPWIDFYFLYAAYGGDCNTPDIPGLYYSLRRLADADPDPATGQNRSISATYRLEAVPAFLVRKDGQLLATPDGHMQ